MKPLLERREGRRLEMVSLRPSRLSLDDKQNLILWWWPPDRLYFLHTVGAQGVKTHAVLCVVEVFANLCLQEDYILSREKTLEQPVLLPLAEAHQDVMHFCSPAIIGNIVSDHIAGGPSPSQCFPFHVSPT